MSLGEMTCEVCGAVFMQAGPTQRFCNVCSEAARAVRGRIGRVDLGTPEERRREFIRLVKIEARARVGRSEVRERVCPYCGKAHRSGPMYCSGCRHKGLDHVHAVTGRSNGWDAVKKEKVTVMNGWRGRPVCGRGFDIRMI